MKRICLEKYAELAYHTLKLPWIEIFKTNCNWKVTLIAKSCNLVEMENENLCDVNMYYIFLDLRQPFLVDI